MVNEYTIPFLTHLSARQPWESIMSKALAVQNLQPLNCLNWPAFPYRPQVLFALTALNDALVLHFEVNENHTLARYTNDGEPVYKDSCVELFIDPLNDGSYYNLEFNCIGTMLMGYGLSRHNREKAPPQIYERIIRRSSLGNEVLDITSPTTWHLDAIIPLLAFFNHDISTLVNQTIRCNLYKCGDETPVPHYISWNPIQTERPDFHRPEYFGNAVVKAL